MNEPIRLGFTAEEFLDLAQREQDKINSLQEQARRCMEKRREYLNNAELARKQPGGILVFTLKDKT